MRKLSHWLFFLITSIHLLCFIESAAAQTDRVYDFANLFSSAQKEELQQQILTLTTSSQLDYAIFTTSELSGNSTEEYANSLYTKYEIGIGVEKSGVLFLIDTASHHLYLLTSGAAADQITQENLEKALDQISQSAQAQGYFQSASTFLDIFEARMNKTDKTEPTGFFSYSLTTFIIAFISASVLSLVGYFFIYHRYQYKPSAARYPFHRYGKLTIESTEETPCNDPD